MSSTIRPRSTAVTEGAQQAFMADRNDDVMPEPSAVSPKKAERMLDISHTQLYELLGRGELEGFEIGRSRRITTRSIEAYIKRQLALTASRGRNR